MESKNGEARRNTTFMSTRIAIDMDEVPDKSIIAADFLIDDNARHFERFSGQGLLFSAPHNVFETRYPRLNSWQDVRMRFL